MTKYRDEDGNEKAECNYCKKTFDASSKKGTTHLKNHSDRCRAKGKEAGGDKDKSEIARDQEEKVKLRQFLNKLSCCFCLEKILG